MLSVGIAVGEKYLLVAHRVMVAIMNFPFGSKLKVGEVGSIIIC